MMPHDSGAVIYGGYSRVKSTTSAGPKAKGSNQATRSLLKPMIHQDTWFLRINQPPPDSASGTPPTVRWERRKRPVNSPNPPRAGATMAFHQGRGIMFGGVHDVEASEEAIDSEFFDALFAWNIERNRFFQQTLRRPKMMNKKQPGQEKGISRRDRGRADEAELLRNLAALQAKGSIEDTDAMELTETASEEVAPAQLTQPIFMTMPHPRFNAQLAVQNDVLYIFGGTYEHGDREFTFDDMYAIDLGRLDGVKEIYKREPENWVASEDEDSDSEDEEEESEDEDMDMEGEGSSGVPLPQAEPEKQTSFVEAAPVGEMMYDEEDRQELATVDNRPHPRPFETLRDFFTRTSNEWQELLLQTLRESDASANKAVKELRKEAFEMAESNWWDCREEITALEDQQEEAGIGEVVSIANRGSEAGGLGRRR